MIDTAATSQDSGAMSVAQAAEAFERQFAPAKEKREASEGDKPQPKAEEEAEADPEQEEEAEAEPEEVEGPEDAEKPVLHTVKVDGEELQVPLDELVKGYQRTADYTRKTQALAEQRKAAESDHEAVRSERAHYSQMLGQLQQQIQQSEPQIDWARLEVENPAEWTRQRVLQQDRLQARHNIAVEQQRVAGLTQAEQEQATHSRLAEEAQKLSAAIPEWKDEGVAKSEKAKLVAFAQERGYTADEIGQVLDSRAILLLRDAMRWQEVSQKRASLKPSVAATPKPAIPGSAPRTSAAANVKRAEERLARTGKVNDAAALFERFL
jgi:hypothetical protein